MRIKELAKLPFQDPKWQKKIGFIPLLRIISLTVFVFLAILLCFVTIFGSSSGGSDFLMLILISIFVLLIFIFLFMIILMFYEGAYYIKMSKNILDKKEQILPEHKDWISTCKFYIKSYLAQLIVSFPFSIIFLIYILYVISVLFVEKQNLYIYGLSPDIHIFIIVVSYFILMLLSTIYAIFYVLPAMYLFFKKNEISAVLNVKKILYISKKTWKIALKSTFMIYACIFILSFLASFVSFIPFGSLIVSAVLYTSIFLSYSLIFGNYFLEVDKTVWQIKQS